MNRNENFARKLAAVDAAISSHPLASAPVKSAFEAIERHGKDNKEAISKELGERNLPSLDELGRIQIRNMFSWWKLHRSRRSLLKKLGRQDDTA